MHTAPAQASASPHIPPTHFMPTGIRTGRAGCSPGNPCGSLYPHCPASSLPYSVTSQIYNEHLLRTTSAPRPQERQQTVSAVNEAAGPGLGGCVTALRGMVGRVLSRCFRQVLRSLTGFITCCPRQLSGWFTSSSPPSPPHMPLPEWLPAHSCAILPLPCRRRPNSSA